MKTKIILTLLIINLFHLNIYSQEENYNILIMGVPQYIFINGIRIDIEKNIKGTNRWIVFSPEFYNAQDPAIMDFTNRFYEIEEILGAGLGSAFKYVFSNKSNAQGVYLAGGASYNYYNITSQGIKWVPESEGSLRYVQEVGVFDTQLNKFGVHSVIGFQSKMINEFFVDFYVGFGLRLSIENNNDNGITDLSTFAGDYGYSGTTLVAGVRIGLGY